MQISIVILNWNGRHHLEKFLPFVTAHTATGKDTCIVVADNGSTDDSVEFIRTNFPEIKLVLLDKNYGYAEGYNKALEQIDSDLYILMNSDIEPSEGWLPPLRKVMETKPEIAALAPKILSYENRNKFEYAGAAGGFIDYLGYPFCRGRILSKIETDQGQYNDFREVFWASGACFVIRADVFKQLGGFDSDFFAHMEEIDLCWRIQLAGYKVAVEPRSSVFHLGGGTLPNNNPRKIYLNYRNNLAMLYKNVSNRTFIPIMLSRMILDGMSAVVFLLQGHKDFCKEVFRAHMDFHKWRKKLNIKRKKIQDERVVKHVHNIYRKSIIFRYYIGQRKFGHMM